MMGKDKLTDMGISLAFSSLHCLNQSPLASLRFILVCKLIALVSRATMSVGRLGGDFYLLLHRNI